MRYSYYNRRDSSNEPRTGRLLRYLLYVVTLIILGIAFTLWSRLPKGTPDTFNRDAFYEGYFTLNSRLNRILQVRFPSMEFIGGEISGDGQAIHQFKLNDPEALRAKDVRRVLETSLEGYGFSVRDSRISADRWEFQLLADSTIWSVFIFEAPHEEIQYSSLLPDDIRLDRKPASIAIVIDDFGYAMNDVIEGFMRLPQTYTAAVIPGRPYSKQVAEKHHKRDRQVLIHMPMITVNNTTSEPDYVLSPEQDAAELRRRLERAAATVPYAAGMNNHQGSGGTQSTEVMTVVADFLRQRDLFFLDSRTIAASVAERVARENGVPAVRRDVFLDDVDDVEAITGELFRLARLARERGTAVAIGHCRRNTLETLKKYLPALEEAGITLVPVSHLARG